MSDFLPNLLTAEQPQTTGPYYAPTQGVPVAPALNEVQMVEQEAAAPGFADTASAAVQFGWIEPNVTRLIGRSGFEPNADWNPTKMTKEQRDELGIDKLPQDYVDQLFSESVSWDHAKAIREGQAMRLKSEEILSQSGWGGTASFIAAVLDPDAIALTIATEGFLGPAVIGEKATRLARVMRYGFLSTASNVSVTGALVAADPLRDAKQEMLLAVGAGMLIGGGLGLRGPHANRLDASIDRARTEFADSATTGLTVEQALREGAEPGHVPAPTGADNWVPHISEDGTLGVAKIVDNEAEQAPQWTTHDAKPTKTADEIARESNPELFAKHDELTAQKTTAAERLRDLIFKRRIYHEARPGEAVQAVDAEIAAAKAKHEAHTPIKQKRVQPEHDAILAALVAKKSKLIDDTVTLDPMVTASRDSLTQADTALRDMAAQVSAAKRAAEEALANEPLRVQSAPITTVMGPTGKPKVSARMSKDVAEEAKYAADPNGLVAMGSGMAKGIGDSLVDHLWSKIEAGETRSTSNSGPDTLLQVAAEIRHRGGEITKDGVRELASKVDAVKGTLKGQEFQDALHAIVDTYLPKVEGDAGAASSGYTNPMVSRTVEEFDRWSKRMRVSARDVWGQIDLYAKLARSKHPGVSAVIDMLTPNPAGARMRTVRVQGRTAVEDFEMLKKEHLGTFVRTLNSAFKKWAEDSDVTLPGLNIEAYRRFNVMVGNYVSETSRAIDAHPAIKQAASAYEKMTADILKLAKDHEVAGFKDVEHSPSYLTRVFNYANFHAIENLTVGSRKVVGTMPLVKLFSEAIMRAPMREGGMTADQAEKMAYVYIQWLKHSHWDTNTGMTPAFNSKLIGALETKLRAELARPVDDAFENALRNSITDDHIAELIGQVQNVGQAGVIGRGKYRLNMDENFSMEIGGRTVKVSDFFERDIARLGMKYATEMTGAIALARHPELKIKSGSDWEKMTGHLDKMASTYHGADLAAHKAEMAGLEVIRRHLFGQPIHDLTATQASLHRAVLGYNYIRLGGQFGLAQAMEFGNVISQVGLKVTMQHVPIMGVIRKDVLAGAFDHELAAELEMLGYGIDGELGHPSMRDLDNLDTTSKVLGKVEDVLSVGKRITSIASGIGPLTDAMERMAAAAIVQKFANMAKAGVGMSVKRMEALGINAAMQKRIFAELELHTTKASNEDGAKVMRMNLSNWSDHEAREVFKTAVWRYARRAVQRNDIGDVPLFMSKWYMQIFGQFRAFQLGAWGKQLAHGVKMGDATSVSNAITTSAFGALGYIALVHMKSIGRQDKDAYLEKNLSMKMIAANGFARSGWSSLLPTTFDSGAQALGFSPTFAAGRTTGLDANWYAGNPTYDLFINAKNAATGIRDLVDPNRSFAKPDGQAMFNLLPGSRTYGLANAYQWLARDLPQKSHYDND